MEEDDDLYGDLSATQRYSHASKHEPMEVAPVKDPSTVSSHSPLPHHHTTTMTELKEENERLKRNMGTLYRTAKAEIQRKNDEISRLLTEIEDLKAKK
jgi:hypothetical protein